MRAAACWGCGPPPRWGMVTCCAISASLSSGSGLLRLADPAQASLGFLHLGYAIVAVVRDGVCRFADAVGHGSLGELVHERFAFEHTAPVIRHEHRVGPDTLGDLDLDPDTARALIQIFRRLDPTIVAMAQAVVMRDLRVHLDVHLRVKLDKPP